MLRYSWTIASKSAAGGSKDCARPTLAAISWPPIASVMERSKSYLAPFHLINDGLKKRGRVPGFFIRCGFPGVDQFLIRHLGDLPEECFRVRHDNLLRLLNLNAAANRNVPASHLENWAGESREADTRSARAGLSVGSFHGFPDRRASMIHKQ